MCRISKPAYSYPGFFCIACLRRPPCQSTSGRYIPENTVSRPGDTFPKIPFPEFYAPQSEPEAVSDITPDVVRALRKSLKLTQIQFGEIFGITSKKVSAWEHGKAEPTEEQKQKIQSLLKENNEQERETR